LATYASAAQESIVAAAALDRPHVLVESVEAGLVTDLTVVPHPPNELADDVAAPHGHHDVEDAFFAAEVNIFRVRHVMPDDVPSAAVPSRWQIRGNVVWQRITRPAGVDD
jgi:hypothetical protein